MTTTFNLDPVSAAVARDVRMWIDAEEHLQAAVRAVCLKAVLEHSGTGDQAQLYAEAVRDGGGEYQRYCETAGLFVRDYLYDYTGITENNAPTGSLSGGHAWALNLLQELLAYGQMMWAEVADSFMPDPDDMGGE